MLSGFVAALLIVGASTHKNQRYSGSCCAASRPLGQRMLPRKTDRDVQPRVRSATALLLSHRRARSTPA
ncbi:hypothetical protein BER93_17780 [Xanthomonas fragariae]|nr:hypothetical protein BER92_17725 [Xanthomonas fragariae]AOD19610.1 hypothetical protein BER93_17780 [Xanthomonas fragariae]ENZ95421.1 hypothetical protein O1K_09972 [Xanthomonas fragariae LMG 25863]